MRLREALAAALAEAHHARAPERLLVLLQRAYQSLESSRFVDDDVIRWAEAGLGAWRRWATAPGRLAHRLLVVDRAGELAQSLAPIAQEMRVAQLAVARSPTDALETLARHAPTAIIFDQDESELSPTVAMLEWLAADFAHIRRMAFAARPGQYDWMRARGLYDALLPKPPSRDQLEPMLARGGDESARDWPDGRARRA